MPGIGNNGATQGGPVVSSHDTSGSGWTTVGEYLATRLYQIGLKHTFVVPGDYNLLLLDKLLTIPEMEQVGCCNELNCSFAAEGYARANGAAACVVTYNVGALSAFDGIAGAYAESLPVILISGSPNTNDAGNFHVLHHTIGTLDLSYQLDMAKKITCAAVAISRAEDAPRLIDYAIRQALLQKKPAYIEVPMNLAGEACAHPGPITAVTAPECSDPHSLAAAVEAAHTFFSSRLKPMILVGPKLRAGGAEQAMVRLAEAAGCAVAVMPSAKSFYPESHPQFCGVYWGAIGTLGTNALIDWTDGILGVGTVFTDYSTIGWRAQPASSRLFTIDLDHVGHASIDFSRVQMTEMLDALARVIKRNDATMLQHNRLKPHPPHIPTAPADALLTRGEIGRQIQQVLTADCTLFAETGDSWFNGVAMQLPTGARFEVEMQWGHIGWSIPASFGYAMSARHRKVVTMIGDGSFQVTAQEASQMVRHKLPVIIFLINNRGQHCPYLTHSFRSSTTTLCCTSLSTVFACLSHFQ